MVLGENFISACYYLVQREGEREKGRRKERKENERKNKDSKREKVELMAS